MRNIRKKKMRARNRKRQKNRRSQSQTAKKQKSEEGKSARQRNPNTPIRNEFDVSLQVFWAECSDKRLSAQYLRPNIQPIYHHPATPSSGHANRTTYQNPKCSQSVRPGMGTILRATAGFENGSRLEKETEAPVSLERTRRT